MREHSAVVINMINYVVFSMRHRPCLLAPLKTFRCAVGVHFVSVMVCYCTHMPQKTRPEVLSPLST